MFMTFGCASAPDNKLGPAPLPPSPSPVITAAPAPESTAARVAFGDLGKLPQHLSSSDDGTFGSVYTIADTPGSPLLLPAAEAVRAADWTRARQLLADVIPKLDQEKDFSPWLVAHALWGRACVGAGDQACAEKEYETVRSAWADPDPAIARARGAGAEAVQLNAVERAVLAVEEAHFFFAEKKRRETVDPLTMPRYKGTGTREDVLQFIAKSVAPWVKQRNQACLDAEKEYRKIALMKPGHSAQWMIQAGSADGAMWAKFAEEFVQAPMPSDWKKDGPSNDGSGMTYAEVRKFWAAGLESKAEPIKKFARAAFEVCKRYAEEIRVQNAASKVCVDWLDKHPSP